MAFVPYITSDEFQAWAQIAGLSKSDQMDMIRDATTVAIDEYCQRHFWQDGTLAQPVARTFEVSHPCQFSLHDGTVGGDLSTVVAPTVETDEAGDGTYETLWAAGDFQLLPYNRPTGRPHTKVKAVAGRRFPVSYGTGRSDQVRITGVWGWNAVPVNVKQACKIKALKLLTRMQSPNGVAGVGDFGPIRISRFEDPDVVSLLDPYRHPATVLVA